MAKLYTLTPSHGGKISDLAQDFLDDLARRGCSPHTVRAYKSALAVLAGALGNKDVSQVAAQELAQALTRGWDKDTAAARQAAVKSFFSWLAAQGYLAADPAAGLGAIRRDEPLPRPFPQGDLDRLLKAADGLPLPPPRTLVRLLADTGMRVGEGLSLDVEDVTWEKCQESVLIRRGKGGRGRVVPVTPDMKCYGLLRRLCREQGRGPLFTTARGGRANYDWAYYWWQKTVEAAGLKEKGCTIHQLRHTAITRWIAGGVNVMAARRLAGHRDLKTTSSPSSTVHR